MNNIVVDYFWRIFSTRPILGATLPISVFTARRYTNVVYAVVVCLSVCLSVTLLYCIKTAKCRLTQIMLHHSLGTLVS